MGQSTISTHLSQLKQAGLVEDRRTGKNVLYQMKAGVAASLLSLLQEAAVEIPEAAGDGIDTLNQHSEFQAAQDPLLRDRGESAQLRTNVLLASTLGCALITAGIGIFLVRWGKPQTTARSFSQEPVLRF